MDKYINYSSDWIDESKLSALIRDSFDKSELRELCHELEIIYEDITGERRTDKARELVLYMKRQNRLNELVEGCKKLRSSKDWNSVYNPLEQQTVPSGASYNPPKYTKPIFTWRKLSILLLLIVGFLILLWLFLQSQCNEILISFRVSSSQESVIVFSESSLKVFSGDVLQITALVNDNEQEGLNRITCEWVVGGDGEILDRSNCNLRFRSGNDNVRDIITLSLNQAGCSLDKVQNLVLVPIE